MRLSPKFLAAPLAAAAILTAPMAVEAADKDPGVKARQALMQLYAHYIGQLGAMAKGAAPYDAAKASAAANSLAALSDVSQAAMWAPGTDNGALGDQTRALPAIWSTYPAVAEKGKAFDEAAANMAAVAGDGLDAVRGAIGPLGASCGGCHKEFRAPEN